MEISLAAIDANYSTDDVLAYARRYPPHKLIAIRGAQGDFAPRIAKVQRERDEKKGVLRKYSNRFFNIGVNQFKMSLYRDLAKDNSEEPGFRLPERLEIGYFKRLWARHGSPISAWGRCSIAGKRSLRGRRLKCWTRSFMPRLPR